MSARCPPRVAMWLVARFAPRYQRDALAGDLFEEYQQGRSRLWYWKQAAVVVSYAGMRLTGALLPSRALAQVLGALLPRSVSSLLRRATKRLIAVMVVTALGVGTLAWAATTYAPSCSTPASCHKAR